MDFDQWQPFKKERKKLNENNITFNLTAPANETCQPQTRIVQYLMEVSEKKVKFMMAYFEIKCTNIILNDTKMRREKSITNKELALNILH